MRRSAPTDTVALSVLNTLVPVVPRETLAAAIAARVPAKFRELNQRAGEAGEQLAAGLMASA